MEVVYKMDRRLFPIFISILLISTSSITPKADDGNIIYVDDDNISGPWDGTIEHPYRFIQQAIDNSSDGDTIFVYNGVYHEDVMIDRSIDLLGEDVNYTIIESTYPITISANYVNLEGFTILGGLVGIVVNSDDNRISGNCISNSYYDGIKLESASSNIITGNIITHNGGGIDLLYAYDNVITENIISSNWIGVGLYKSNNNILSDNTFLECGIFLQSSWENNVYNNTVNGKPLIYLYGKSNVSIVGNAGQVILLHCSNITVRDQVLSKLFTAIQLWDAHNCLISNVTISETSLYGIELISSDHNIILNSNISGGLYGICLDSSNDNLILDNIIYNNTEGVFLACSNNNTISNNNLIKNELGVYFYRNSFRNDVHYNNFLENVEDAYFLDPINADNSWNENYWGRPRILPRPIIGDLVIRDISPHPTSIPWVKFDWHPARESYNFLEEVDNDE